MFSTSVIVTEKNHSMGLGRPWEVHLTPVWRKLSVQGWVYTALGWAIQSHSMDWNIAV